MTKARQRLRDTLRHLIKSGAVSYSAWVESDAVSNGGLARIISEEGQNLTLDNLDLIAYALGVEPWQLLHPDHETATLSKAALNIARVMDTLKPEAQASAYALFVQQVEFGNARLDPGDVSSDPAAKRPRALRKVRR